MGLALATPAKGEFGKAGAIYDQILENEDKQLAADHYERGGIFELEFQPEMALSQYKRAYESWPADAKYAFTYGSLLYKQEHLAAAEPVLRAFIRVEEKQMKGNDSDQATLAIALSYFANICRFEQPIPRGRGCFP